MAKDPAFLFYPNDYMGGTMGMTFEEKGAYVELLMMQFNRGHMTSHMIGQMIGQIWVKIQDKFIQDEKGLWYNKRLEEEQNKRKAYSESRRNNKSGTNQHTKKLKKESGHMTSHMENENENINKDKDEKKKAYPDFFNEKLILIYKEFLQFRKEKKKTITKTQEPRFLEKLTKLSNKNPDIAVKILIQSIEQGWQGIFELNNKQDKKTSKQLDQSDFSTPDLGW